MPEAQVSIKQKRHGEHDSVIVTIAEGFRSASYDLSISSGATFGAHYE